MENKAYWRQAARVYEQRAKEYDAWFEESPLFAAELAVLKGIVTPFASPRLEVGVGPGRFARELGVEFGVDPALAPLRLASGRGIRVCRAVGEALPVRTGSLGTVFLLFTLCFIEKPPEVLAECRRVLAPGGHLVLGCIVAQSSWGREIARKKEAGHPFYRHARLYDSGQVEQWLAGLGLVVVERRSGLFRPPGEEAGPEEPRSGLAPGAGMAALVAEKPSA